MTKIKNNSVFLSLGIVSAYLTMMLFSKDILKTILQCMFVFIYFFLLGYIGYRIVKKILNKSKKRQRIIEIILVLLLLIVSFDFFKVESKNEITISAIGEKNINSGGKEVWITEVKIDGSILNLSDIELPDQWFYRDNAIISTPDEKENIITLTLPRGKVTEITFLNHPWSGLVEVSYGEIVHSLDLYSQTGDGTTINIESAKDTNSFLLFFNLLAILMLLYYFVFIGLNISVSNQIASMTFSLLFNLILMYCTDWERFNTSVICFLMFVNILTNVLCKKPSERINTTTIILLSLLSTFLIFGARIFIISDTINAFEKVALYSLFSIWMVPIIKSIFIFWDWLKKSIHKENRYSGKKINRLVVFLVSILIGLIISGIVYEMNFYSTHHSIIKIRASGEKNKNALGNEVWIGNIVINGKEFMASTLVELPDGWRDVNGMILGEGSTELVIELPKAKDIKITFNKHAWSGIVEIIDGTKTKQIDLYSDKSTSYIKSYQVTGNRKYFISFISVIVFLLVFFITSVLAYSTLFGIMLSWSSQVSKKRFFVSILLLTFSCLSLYVFASYPAALSIDSRTQLEQILGVTALNDAHPVAHTLLLKALITIAGGVFGVTIAQVIFLGVLISTMLTYLYTKGGNRQVLIVFSIIASLSINNGIYVTIIWKDIPYSLCILWITYLVYRICIDKKFLNNLLNVFAVMIALVGVYLLRHNGFIAFYIIIILFIILAILQKNIRYIITILLTSGCIIFIKGPVYQYYVPQENLNIDQNGSGAIPLVHGLVFADLQNQLPKDSQSMLYSIMEKEDWKNCYNAYSANEMILSQIAMQNNVGEKIAEIGTSTLLKQYIKVLPYAGIQLIQDRLTGTDLLWNVFQDKGYNWRVANDTYEIGVVTNDFSIYRKDNIFTEILRVIMQFSMDNKILDALFWRAGIWCLVSLVLIGYVIKEKKYILLNLFIPCLGNCISLLLGMAWQDFRYVYFMNLCIPFVILFVLSDNSKNV